jgi:threonine dehydratase
MHDVLGWACAVCDARVDLTDATPWRCPNSSDADRHHVLHVIRAGVGVTESLPAVDGENPFLRYDRRLAWAAAAAARGMTTAARAALVVELDERVRLLDGTGFVTTPFQRSDRLSDALGFTSAGGVWVKNETGGVGGSHKARHLFTILLHLRAMEVLGELPQRPRLAIASCGNAALAAATLANAAEWPIDVYVPTWMSRAFGDRLDELGATTHRCERRAADPPGDPAMLRFREAVAAGSVPFTVQGPENALCLDGGRTIGWEIADQIAADESLPDLDAIFVQVGGGAFASCLGAGLLESGVTVPLMAVQAAGCAPFDRAFRRAAGVDEPGRAWSSIMEPWTDPHSTADGILDDETYDWLGVLDVVRRSGGDSLVAFESEIIAAHRLALDAGFEVSPTGSAGLAGLLEPGAASTATRWTDSDRRVAVVMSGVTR